MTVSEVSGLRAANVDRVRVVERLNRAHAEGRLALLEFDERLAAAHAARTYGDLEPLTSDLPTPEVVASSAGRNGDGERSGDRAGAGGRRSRGYALALRIETGAWLFATAVNLLIWAIVSLAGAKAACPWWIWVAGPWGMVLVARMLGQRVLLRFRTRF
jgi:hypothetical protein